MPLDGPGDYKGGTVKPRAPQTSPYVDQFGAATQFFQTQYGPEFAALQNEQARYNARAAQMRASGGGSSQGLHDNYDIGMRQIGLQREGLGIDRNAANRQLGYYDQLGGLQTRGLNEQLGYIGQQRGFAGEGYQNVYDQLGFQGEAIDANAEREAMLAKSAAIAAGAVTSEGLRDDQGFIETGRQRDQNILATQKYQVGLEYREKLANLDAQTKSLLTDHEITKLSNEEQKARLSDRLQQLDITARQYDLSAEQLAANLKNGLSSMGAGNSIAVGQLMDAAASANTEQAALARHVIDQALMYAPYFPAPASTSGNRPRSGRGGGGFRGAGASGGW